MLIAAPQWTSYLPIWLHREGPYDLQWWQWVTLMTAIIVAIAFGAVASRVLRAILARVVAQTSTAWDDKLLAGMRGPLNLFAAIIFYRALLPLAEPTAGVASNVNRLLAALLFVALYWALIRTVWVAQEIVLSSKRAEDEPNLRLIAPQIGRIARFILFALLVVSLLAQMGYHVASLITGLGIGGIAVALAAQSSLQNLFASIGIAADKPFELGDFVKIEETLGTVEEIGLRSTRVRTLDRTLVTWPNGKLATMKVERYTARDRIRLHAIIGVLYSTTSAQLEQILAGFERVIREHPQAWQETVVVKFAGFGDSALQIEVMCWFNTIVFDEFRAHRQDVLIGFMKVVEQAGSAFAFPTRTLHIASGPETAYKPA